MSIFATENQQRWGRAVSLLSLDRVRPFYDWMKVPTTEPEKFKSSLRDAVLVNRQDFVSDPSSIPDLRNRVLGFIAKDYRSGAGDAFQNWVEHGFVYAPRDMLPAGSWWDLLDQSRWQDDQWQLVGMPPRLSDEARAKLDWSEERERLNALDEKVDTGRLSAWDAEMYALHGYDSGDNDPIHRIGLTVRKRVMLAFLRWLTMSLTREERADLLASAERRRAEIADIPGSEPLLDLAVVLERHARDP